MQAASRATGVWFGSAKPIRPLVSAKRWPAVFPSGAAARCSTACQRWSASAFFRSPAAMPIRTTQLRCAPIRCSRQSVGASPRVVPIWLHSQHSRVWRTLSIVTPVRPWPRQWWRCTSASGSELARRPTWCWTSTALMIRSMAIRRVGPIMAFYREHIYHPLLIFDGQTDQLITAVLRPGRCHESRFVVLILRRLLKRLRAAWPQVTIELRADSGFAVPRLYAWCEANGVTYTIGMIPNRRLAVIAAPLLSQALVESKAQGGSKVRLAGETAYQARTWIHPRRVVYKAEALSKGPNTRFVVTTRSEDPMVVYDWYVDRGEPENWLKDLKNAVEADRLSDHRFWANAFRLLMHAAAYWLLDTLRSWLIQAIGDTARVQLDTLRLRLIKIGGRLRELPGVVRLHLASSHPGEPLWQALYALPPDS